MVIAGIILLILGIVFGVLRPVTVPLGAVLLCIGIVWDVIAFTGHAITAVF